MSSTWKPTPNNPSTSGRSGGAHGRLGRAAALSLLLLFVSGLVSAQNFQQSLTLQPGWNAVFLEVEPPDTRVEAVFQGIPVASVWTYNSDQLGVEFLQDPAEGLFNQEGWLGYFPEPRPESILSNLFEVEVNRAYLIKLDGTQPFTWNLVGRPSHLPLPWQPDSYNLTGFRVNPTAPPSFGNFLEGDDALAGQPIYQLATDGTWQLVAAPYSTLIQQGKAYWVYADGSSNFQGLLELELEFEDGLFFGPILNQLRLGFTNTSDIDSTVFLRKLPSANPVTLVIDQFDPDTGESSSPVLPPVYGQPLAAGKSDFAELGVRRTQFVADIVETVLEVTDSQGTRFLLPVEAQTLSSQQIEQAAIASGSSALRTSSNDEFAAESRALTMRTERNTAMSDFAGLWVGNVSVNGVSESQLGGTSPTAVAEEFVFRVIIHVDSGGQARLLKDVILMFEEGTLMPDPENPGFFVVDRPSRYVLITDDSLISQFGGASLRDGSEVGYRVSTIGYDFPGQFLSMLGSFDSSGQVLVDMTLASNFPTNPFRHKFHPDHDNLDPQFLNPRPEAPTVNRSMRFEFSPVDPLGGDRPGYGDQIIGGTYRETLAGLHKNNIFVEGRFELERIASVVVLNQ